MNYAHRTAHRALLCLFLVNCTHSITSTHHDINVENSFSVETIHGSMQVTDPLIIELINSPAMQRLKHIKQYGTTDYVMRHKTVYTRFDHSLGVYYILCQHGAGRAEQVAGLLHDVSHTVFSHVCDLLFMGDLTKGAYQDFVHEEFLNEHGIREILAKHGFTVADIMPKNSSFRALEQEAPALCADRIEYNLYAAHMDNLLSQEDLDEVRRDLHFDGHDWYFDRAHIAKKFALISLHQTVYLWGSPHNILIAQWTCDALKRALDIGLITQEDICYTMTDEQMWSRLTTCNDAEIVAAMDALLDCNRLFSWSSDDEQGIAITLKAKCRGVDPLVNTAQGLQPLSAIDADFKKNYELVKKNMRKGWHVLLHKKPLGDVAKNSLDPRLAIEAIVDLQKNTTLVVA